MVSAGWRAYVDNFCGALAEGVGHDVAGEERSLVLTSDTPRAREVSVTSSEA